MKKYVFLLLTYNLLFSVNVISADWPGTGSCSTTLQACINAVADGSTINVVTNTPILAGTYTITKGLTLQAGSGFHPQFSNITVVTLAPPSGKKVTIEGFEFHGFAYVDVALTINNEINIKNNKWFEPDLGIDRFEGIQVHVSTALIIGNTATFNFIGNDLHGAGSNGAFGFIDVFNNQTGTLKANIVDNHLKIENAGSINPAVFIVNAANGQIDAQIVANTIHAENDFLVLQQGNIGAQEEMNIGVISNLFTGGKNLGAAIAVNDLIRSEVSKGTFNGIFANNTIDGGGGTSKAFNFMNHTTTSVSSINISNNIIVNTNAAYQGPASGTSSTVTSSGHNVFFNEGTMAGLSLLSSDFNQAPMFIKDGINYALQAASPAIDTADIASANTLYTSGFMQGSPRIDADGLRRYKGTKLDSGAIEWGDRHILHQAISPFANVSVTSDAPFNNDNTAVPILTQVWNYENLPGIYNNHPIGVYRNSNWGIINEDSMDIPTNSKYHFFYPYGQDFGGTNLNGLIRWTTPTSTASGFDLDDIVLLNNNADVGVFVSNFWDANNTPTNNPHSLEIGYKFTTNKWFLANSDGANMPANAQFLTYNQDYSRNVFNHKMSVDNTQGNVTLIDHPLLNGNSCALPTVTQVASFGLFNPAFGNNPHHIGVFYAASFGRWAIFNQDLVALNIPALGVTSFNVLVDPQQVYVCNTKILFADGFE